MTVQQGKSIPPDVLQLATTHHLGKPQLAVAGETSGMLVFSLIGSGFFAVGFGILTLLSAGYAISSAYYNVLELSLFLGGATAFFLLLALRAWRELQAARGSNYYVFSDGLIVQQGSTSNACSWKDIAAVWQAAYRLIVNGVPVTRYTYTLDCTDGRMLKLSWRTEQMRQLGTHIVRSVAEQQLPQALRELHAGQTLNFGSFSLSLGGLTYKKATLPWNEVRKVEVNNGTVFIKKTSKRLSWAQEPARSIPNYTVFMTLVEYMARTQ
jgi:hypothetical protein